MLPHTADTDNASQQVSVEDDDGQQCGRGTRAPASVADNNLNDDDDDRCRITTTMPPSPHLHSRQILSANEYFSFNHPSSKSRTSISSNDAVFMTLSPSSPSHYFSSCSDEVEDSNHSPPPIIPHSNHRSHSAASPNANTPRIGDGGGGADVGVGSERRRNNSAMETSLDKIDDNSYGAWWFLSSNSESFGNTPNRKQLHQPSPPPTPPPLPGIDENENRMNNMMLRAEGVTITTNATMSNYEEDMQSDGWMEQKISSTTASTSATTNNTITGGPGAVLPMSAENDDQRKIMTFDASNQIPFHHHPPPTPHGMPMADKAKLNATLSFASPPQTQVMGEVYTVQEQRHRIQNNSRTLNNNDFSASLFGAGSSLDGLDCSAGTYVPPPYNYQSSSLPVSFSIGNNADEDDWDMAMAAKYDRRRYRLRRHHVASIEWTPPDSSYGAAIPACGWIPKRIRKSLEVVFFVLSVALLIFVLVKAGLELRSSGSSSSSTSSSSGSSEYSQNDDLANENAGNNAGNMNGNGRNNYRLVRT